MQERNIDCVPPARPKRGLSPQPRCEPDLEPNRRPFGAQMTFNQRSHTGRAVITFQKTVVRGNKMTYVRKCNVYNKKRSEYVFVPELQSPISNCLLRISTQMPQLPPTPSQTSICSGPTLVSMACHCFPRHKSRTSFLMFPYYLTPISSYSPSCQFFFKMF